MLGRTEAYDRNGLKLAGSPWSQKAVIWVMTELRLMTEMGCDPGAWIQGPGTRALDPGPRSRPFFFIIIFAAVKKDRKSYRFHDPALYDLPLSKSPKPFVFLLAREWGQFR